VALPAAMVRWPALLLLQLLLHKAAVLLFRAYALLLILLL